MREALYDLTPANLEAAFRRAVARPQARPRKLVARGNVAEVYGELLARVGPWTDVPPPPSMGKQAMNCQTGEARGKAGEEQPGTEAETEWRLYEQRRGPFGILGKVYFLEQDAIGGEAEWEKLQGEGGR